MVYLYRLGFNTSGILLRLHQDIHDSICRDANPEEAADDAEAHQVLGGILAGEKVLFKCVSLKLAVEGTQSLTEP